MEGIVLSLVVVPWVAALLVLMSPKPLMRFITSVTMVGMSVLAFVMLFTLRDTITVELPSAANIAVAIVDFAVILYFTVAGWKHRNWLVGLLALAQGGLLAWLLVAAPHEAGPQILVNNLSVFMYLLINVVSGVICIYALRYIEDEDTTPQRRRNFMAIILAFVGVMNLIVSLDNIEYFFLAFELTTLASYLLIRFRGCATSMRNAAQALWMNQVGGVAILVGLLVSVHTAGLNTVNFSTLIAQSQSMHVMLPVALIAAAAMVKGAQMPFSSWLLGAMVAPTPVSALLHSSTMVKIAPFTILKLSPALAGTPVAWAIIIAGSLVFLMSSLLALAKEDFKLILANSTIALLGLMIAMAAVGTPQAITAALFLMMFHGVSKCLLFLNAGILEKVFHIKKITQLEHFAKVGPLTALFIAIGFMSLVLPPFGAFMGKWITVETMGAGLNASSFINVAALVAIVMGSAVMALLYLRVVGILVARDGSTERPNTETMSPYYVYTSIALIFILLVSAAALPLLATHVLAPATAAIALVSDVFGAQGLTLLFGGSSVSLWIIFCTMILLPGVLIAGSMWRFRNVDRAKEYACGEKTELSFSSYFFDFDRWNPAFVAVGVICFVSIVVAGRIPF